MLTPTSFGGQPVHPKVVPIPIGLWFFSFVCQFIALFDSNPNWLIVARYAAAGGILGALLAALFGFVDYFSIRDRHVRSYGTRHMIANLSAVVVWAADYFLLDPAALRETMAFLLSAVGVVLISYSGWMGGEMVYRHWVGVKPATDAKEAFKQTTKE